MRCVKAAAAGVFADRLEHSHDRAVGGVHHDSSIGRSELLIKNKLSVFVAVAVERFDSPFPAGGIRLVFVTDDVSGCSAARRDGLGFVLCGVKFQSGNGKFLAGFGFGNFLLTHRLSDELDDFLLDYDERRDLLRFGFVDSQLLLGFLLSDL